MAGTMNFLQVARTVRHLKPRQMAYQLYRRLGFGTQTPVANGRLRLRKGVALSHPLQCRMEGGESVFRFLNSSQRFNIESFDWRVAHRTKLWRYNLHYFDYLHQKGRLWSSKAALVDSWIKNNPPGLPDAWDPFPASLRIVNWIKFFLSSGAAGNLDGAWLRSLYNQALWLEKNIEYHLLANHYFKNGKALLFAGVFFQGANGERWINKGLRIVASEVEEQILRDGGHFERSPMYHAMILEDCLDIFNLCRGNAGKSRERLKEILQEPIQRMVEFLNAMTHPDGQIALFNDAAFGVEASPGDLTAYSERLTEKKISGAPSQAQSFPATGYYIMAPRKNDKLIIDCGPVGPDYQPGHSHCDTLSFELSLNGRRIIVDSGCCQYEDGEIRRYNRGNPGHNTLTIDRQNQSEVWGAHRCARRAYPVAAKLCRDNDDAILFEGAHDGYKRLYGSPIHHRMVRWFEDEIHIEDRVEGKGRHAIESRLHIHPELSVDCRENAVVLRDGDRLSATLSGVGPGRIELDRGWYCPEFGIQRRCRVVCRKYKNESLPFNTGWRLRIHRS
jgi:uncharacterized heparinase superfamily protein